MLEVRYLDDGQDAGKGPVELVWLHPRSETSDFVKGARVSGISGADHHQYSEVVS